MSDLPIRCPNCKKQLQLNIDEGRYHYVCGACGKSAEAFVAKVRAKKSRAKRQRGMRSYSIRLLHSGIEDLIEFDGPYGEFEMRAGDWVVFGYDLKNRLSILQNLTLRNYMAFPKPAGCLPLAIGLVAVLLLVFVVVAVVGSR